VEQILRGYEAIKGKRKSGKIREHLGATIEFLKPRRVSWKDSLGSPRNSQRDFDIVIFAVGFGVEHQVDQNKATSYWRNDSINQPKLTTKKITPYIITGTGDGGLIDLLRVRIQNFHQGHILEEMIQGGEQDKLVTELRAIMRDWGAHSAEESWLYDQYVRLYDKDLLEKIKKSLKSRMRKDTEAILNGRAKDFSQVLRLDKASLFNTLITFILEAEGEIEYVGGEYSADEHGVRIGDRRVVDEEVIIRHGTDRKAIFEEAGFTEGVTVLQKQDPIRERIDTSGTLWPPGWWGEHAKNALSGERVEFVPPATQAIATTFVSTLSDVIELHKSSTGIRFRITLHRLISVNDEDFFQQISEYAGTKDGAKSSRKSKRVFKVSGLVGLVCRLGRPIIVVRDDEEEFQKIWGVLNFINLAARPIDSRVQSLFGCPFLATGSGGAKSKYVSLVLFMDSEQKDFFTPEVMRTIYAACRGFVENLENMNTNGDVFFAPSDYRGYFVKRSEATSILRQFKSVKTDHVEFKNFVEELTFSSVTFFDAYLR